MDIRCPRCGEPWDFDTLHEAAAENDSTYEKVAADFRRRGCVALFGDACSPDPNEPVNPRTGLKASEAAATLYDLLGDDMDGAAALLEDEGF